MANYVVLYHDNCVDGFAAAWAAKQWFDLNDNDDDTMEYIPVNYNQDYDAMGIPDKIKGKDVFVFDFSFKRETMLRYKDLALTFEVHDHHKTAEKECEGLDFCTFDMNKSGAVMAWDRLMISPPPLFLYYVQDYDLWKFDLADSKAINAVIQQTPKTFEEYTQLSCNIAFSFNSIALQGETILKTESQIIAGIIKHPMLMDIGRFTVPAINNSVFVSKATGELAKGQAFAASFFLRQDGQWVVSLRSTFPKEAGSADVSAIARKYGGGGHAGAAGFTVPMDELYGMFVYCKDKNCKSLANHFDKDEEPKCELHRKD